jgi:hypothetical protein
MPAFTLLLEDLDIVHTPRVVESVIRIALSPIARRAGRNLRLIRSGSADLSLIFDRGGRAAAPCGLLFFGNEAGEIWVGACEDLRVYGDNPRTRLQHVFSPREVAFGRFVGNTAVHELGHMIARLSHSSYRYNFMRTGNPIPQPLRTRDNMRRYWASRCSFTPPQVRSLTSAIRTGAFHGGMSMIHIPP